MKGAMLLVCLLLGSAQAFAGDAGCGLGGLIFQNNAKLIQLFALTTNASFSSQALGITSGTSRCSASGIVMQEKAIQYYVEVNQEDITREMAQGEGEKLKTLAALYGCEGSAIHDFSQMTQSSFGRIVESDHMEVSAVVKNLNREFKNSPSLSQACQPRS